MRSKACYSRLLEDGSPSMGILFCCYCCCSYSRTSCQSRNRSSTYLRSRNQLDSTDSENSWRSEETLLPSYPEWWGNYYLGLLRSDQSRSKVREDSSWSTEFAFEVLRRTLLRYRPKQLPSQLSGCRLTWSVETWLRSS